MKHPENALSRIRFERSPEVKKCGIKQGNKVTNNEFEKIQVTDLNSDSYQPV